MFSTERKTVALSRHNFKKIKNLKITREFFLQRVKRHSLSLVISWSSSFLSIHAAAALSPATRCPSRSLKWWIDPRPWYWGSSGRPSGSHTMPDTSSNQKAAPPIVSQSGTPASNHQSIKTPNHRWAAKKKRCTVLWAIQQRRVPFLTNQTTSLRKSLASPQEGRQFSLSFVFEILIES